MPGGANRSAWSFRARPLFWIALAFMVGVGRSGWPTASSPVVTGTVSMLLLAAASFSILRFGFGHRSPATVISLLVVFLALGFLRGQAAAPRLPYPTSLAPYFERPDTVFIAHLKSPLDFFAHKTRFILELEAALVDGQKIPVQGGVQLSVGQTDRVWAVGTVVLAPLTLKQFHNFGTPGAFDYAWFRGARGIYARAYLKTDAELTRCRSSGAGLIQRSTVAMAAAIDRYRQRLRQWIQGRIDRDSAVLAQALLLGYRHEIEPDFRDALSRAGVNHLLAISGLHLGLVALGLFYLGRKTAGWVLPHLLRRSSDRPPAWGAALIGALLYALISGLALPTWRAAVMLTLLATAILNYRQPDQPTFLAAAAFLMLVYDPNALWMVSFQLSFASFAGILLVFPRFQPILGRLEAVLSTWPSRWLKPIVSAFFISLAVNVVILPILAYDFHGISIAGFFANAVLVPLVGFLVLPLGLLSVVLFPISPVIADPLLILDGRLLAIVRHLIYWIGGFNWSFVWVGLIPLWVLAAFYSGLALILFGRGRGRGLGRARLLTGGLLVISVLFGIASLTRQPAATGRLEVDVIDIGQGSSTLLISPHGRTVLIDGGGYWDHSFDIGRNVLAPFLWQKGIQRLDLVILSHDHPDHRNGLRFILSQFEVGEYWETGYTRHPNGRTILSLIAAGRRVPERTAAQLPLRRVLDGCTLRVLHPNPNRMDLSRQVRDLNNLSLVLAVRFKNTRVLVPGDIDRSVEQQLPVSNAGLETVLIAPHHGSRRSTGAELLDRLHPAAVLISCGFHNWFGFPTPEMLERLQARSIPVFRTDRNGTISAYSDGQRWQFHCYSNGSR